MSDGLYGTTQDTTLDQLMKHMSDWNHPFVFDIGYTLPIAPDTNNAVGIGERGMLHAFSYSGKHFYCIDASKGWQESPYALKSDLIVNQVVDPTLYQLVNLLPQILPIQIPIPLLMRGDDTIKVP